MDEILEDLPGVVGITDDVCVHGKDEEEHDRNLKALMDRAKETGLVFNSDKCTIRQPEISFFGNIYSKDGIRPDPAKVHDIQNMPVPQDKEDLQRFLGMMTYLATFIPNFIEESQPLRDLLKKKVPFEMSEDHLHCFQKFKTAISAKSCVKYIDPAKPTTLEVVQRKVLAQQFYRTVNLLHSHPKRSTQHKATTQTLTGRCSPLCSASIASTRTCTDAPFE